MPPREIAKMMRNSPSALKRVEFEAGNLRIPILSTLLVYLNEANKFPPNHPNRCRVHA